MVLELETTAVRAYIVSMIKKDFVICRCRMGQATGLSRCFGPNELGLNSEGRNYCLQTHLVPK
jgi:hypothetical protein